MGCGVKMHGGHLVGVGPCESAADQFIRELMTHVIRKPAILPFRLRRKWRDRKPRSRNTSYPS